MSSDNIEYRPRGVLVLLGNVSTTKNKKNIVEHTLGWVATLIQPSFQKTNFNEIKETPVSPHTPHLDFACVLSAHELSFIIFSVHVYLKERDVSVTLHPLFIHFPKIPVNISDPPICNKKVLKKPPLFFLSSCFETFSVSLQKRGKFILKFE